MPVCPRPPAVFGDARIIPEEIRHVNSQTGFVFCDKVPACLRAYRYSLYGVEHSAYIDSLAGEGAHQAGLSL
jgi:hypothetical protein